MINVSLQCQGCGSTVSFASCCDSVDTEEVQQHMDKTFVVRCGGCSERSWEVVNAEYLGAFHGL